MPGIIIGGIFLVEQKDLLPLPSRKMAAAILTP